MTLDLFLSTIDVSTDLVFVSCGFLMSKYVITAYLTYMYFIQKLAWGGRGYVEIKQFFHVTEFRATNILAFFHPNSFTETK